MIGRNCHHNVIIDEYDPNGMVIKNQWLKWLIQLESIEKYCNLNLESIEILNILKVYWNSWNLADLLNFLLNLEGLLKFLYMYHTDLNDFSERYTEIINGNHVSKLSQATRLRYFCPPQAEKMDIFGVYWNFLGCKQAGALAGTPCVDFQ